MAMVDQYIDRSKLTQIEDGVYVINRPVIFHYSACLADWFCFDPEDNEYIYEDYPTGVKQTRRRYPFDKERFSDDGVALMLINVGENDLAVALDTIAWMKSCGFDVFLVKIPENQFTIESCWSMSEKYLPEDGEYICIGLPFSKDMSMSQFYNAICVMRYATDEWRKAGNYCTLSLESRKTLREIFVEIYRVDGPVGHGPYQGSLSKSYYRERLYLISKDEESMNALFDWTHEIYARYNANPELWFQVNPSKLGDEHGNRTGALLYSDFLQWYREKCPDKVGNLEYVRSSHPSNYYYDRI